MFKTVILYLALAVFLAGLAFKVSTWFRYSIAAGRHTTLQRVSAAARGVALTLFSAQILTLIKVFFLDVICQIRIFRNDRGRWASHMLIFSGFTMLLLMHALEAFTSSKIFSNYYSTINPFFFLRDFFGAMVLFGVAMSAYRQSRAETPKAARSAMDVYMLAILGLILVSGILLEGVKIASPSAFQDMVDEYAGPQDQASLKALEAYWVGNFGLFSRDVAGPFSPEILAEGRTVHSISCEQCHSAPQWAFMGYGVSGVLPAAYLDGENARTALFYLHFLACMFGLAYLPFSKSIHMLVSPLSLLANAVMDRDRSHPANIATRQIMELDACTHCAFCTDQCSLSFIQQLIPNVTILPSEKIASIRTLARGQKLSAQDVRVIQDGLNLCTNCNQCTQVCPVGINLKDLWFSVREGLFVKDVPEFMILSPLSFPRGMMKNLIDSALYEKPIHRARDAIATQFDGTSYKYAAKIALAPEHEKLLDGTHPLIGENTFSNCYRCMTCTLACPVVRHTKNPAAELGLFPHQMMHAVGLRLWKLVFSSKMLWDCLGCYQCQEQCPMAVPVTELVYLLRNVAISRTTQNFPHTEAI
ncbi:MAG: 4Fe-4S dicluster domain-containing protein [Syntrophobacteraceae bacterium]